MTQVTETKPNLTGGRLLARNTVWNLVGLISPVVVGLAVLPPLIRTMGDTRFGVLSLAWVVIGYFSMFDLGIGRALTKLVADKLGTREEHAIPSLVWTSLLLMLLLGVVGSVTMWATSPWLVHRILKVPQELQTETLRSFLLLGASIPIVTITSGLRGILEAQQRFRVLSFIRVPMSIFSLAGPLLVLPFSHSLVPVVGVLIVGRLAGAVAHLIACLRAMPALGRNIAVERSLARPVLQIGGWMTVSNLIAPIIVYIDRFLIGALLSIAAVTYYTAPFDTVNRLLIVPGALGGVLFPAFAVSLMQDPQRTVLLLGRGIKYVFMFAFPTVLLIVAFAPEGLRLWLGPAFSANSSAVTRWLAAGIFINCLAQMPFTLVQGVGRPDVTAKVHLVQLPVYLAALWWLVKVDGIEGAAIAWVLRVATEAVVFFAAAHVLLPKRPEFFRMLAALSCLALVTFYAVTIPGALQMRIGVVAALLLLFVLVVWVRVLAPEERAFLLRLPGSWNIKTKAVS